MDEFMKALDLLDEEETMTDYQKREAKRRLLFFKAIGKPDDGRRCPTLTRTEFYAFRKEHPETDKPVPKNVTTVEVFFDQVSYYDYSYKYCFDDDTIYESGFYVGD